MRNQRLTRQKNSHAVPRLARVVGNEGRRPGHIDERDIARIESHGLIVMGNRSLASELKDGEVVVRTI